MAVQLGQRLQRRGRIIHPQGERRPPSADHKQCRRQEPATVAAAMWHRPAVVPIEPNDAIAPDDPVWDDYSVWRPGRMPSGSDVNPEERRDEETE